MSKVLVNMTKKLPTIDERQVVAKSKFFSIEQLELTFTNGTQRQYERMKGSGRGAVMVVPMLDNDTMMLIREYCAGTHSYELSFPKGLIDPGESPEIAANRELKEEIGFGANKLTEIIKLAMAPTFFAASMNVFIANDLYEKRLPGDEPEELDIVPWKLSDYKSLLAQPDFNEARSVAALMLVKDYLSESNE